MLLAGQRIRYIAVKTPVESYIGKTGVTMEDESMFGDTPIIQILFDEHKGDVFKSACVLVDNVQRLDIDIDNQGNLI